MVLYIYIGYNVTDAQFYWTKVERKFESDGEHNPRVSKLENAV